MRALDGTYWRFKRPNGCVSEMKAPTKWQILVWHNPELGRPVRIRPRMSIVKAVRLLTEARKQGVELWMQEQGDDKSRDWYYPDDIFDFHAFTGSQVSSKWIVATPEDARRIDARGKK